MAKDSDGEWRQIGITSFGPKLPLINYLPRPGKLLYIFFSELQCSFLGVATKVIEFCKWVNLVTDGAVSCNEYRFPNNTLTADATKSHSSTILPSHASTFLSSQLWLMVLLSSVISYVQLQW